MRTILQGVVAVGLLVGSPVVYAEPPGAGGDGEGRPPRQSQEAGRGAGEDFQDHRQGPPGEH